MQTIHKLPDHLIAQIAAGEVIERPSYVVKELIDNALDADARRISIDLEEGGTKKIVVTDDGTGMTREDVVEAVKLHTTSKVHDLDEFLGIKTLGFRGEALASIASVSQLTIESRTDQDTVGTKIVLFAENLTTTSMGMPKGTRVIVESLFSTVPARKKFLKSSRIEFKHIVDIVNNYAAGHPEVSFELSHNGKSWFHLPSHQSFKERLVHLFGKQIESHLLPIDIEDSLLSLSGFIGTPQLSSLLIPEDILIVNGRPVNDRLIRQAVKEGYGVLLEPDTQPIFFFQLSIPTTHVDVNVHPRKEQIHLLSEQQIFLLLSKSVTDVLTSHEITFTSSMVREPGISYGTPLLKTTLAQTLKKDVRDEKAEKMTQHGIRRIMSLHNLYIVIEADSGMTIIDQHAAHERILYESYKKAFFVEKEKQQRIDLSPPILIELSVKERALFESHLSYFEEIGFEIEEFSGGSFRITKASSLFADRDIKTLLLQLLRDLETDTVIKPIDSETKKMLAYLACRSAVKAGDPLTNDQIQMIIEEIKAVPAGATCPHGRPVRVDIPMHELHKMFKRR